MMSKRTAFWDQMPHNEEGSIEWPEDAEVREKLVRDAFGAKVIEALEAILEEQWEISDGRPPRRRGTCAPSRTRVSVTLCVPTIHPSN